MPTPEVEAAKKEFNIPCTLDVTTYSLRSLWHAGGILAQALRESEASLERAAEIIKVLENDVRLEREGREKTDAGVKELESRHENLVPERDQARAEAFCFRQERDEQKARADASEARVMELMAGHHNWSQRAIFESNRGDAAEANAVELAKAHEEARVIIAALLVKRDEQKARADKADAFARLQTETASKVCGDNNALSSELAHLRAEVASLIKSTGEHVTVRAELRAENERMRKVLLWLIGPDGPLYGVDSQVLDRIQAALDGKEAGK